MKRPVAGKLFWLVIWLLIASLILTISGSTFNSNPVLNIGIVSWLASSFLLFAWLVIWMLSRSSRYRK
ncbi:MAG: hypothetical protein SWK76_03835 [Actinomycetota bacterium]|nr:hypothetical protein [Actinomycetota bacterium]